MGEETWNHCRSWAEEVYWTHFQCIHFSQFLHAGFDQSLAIPEKFTRNLRKKLPDIVTLKSPSGIAWKIGLVKSNNTLFFNHGWQEFVRGHFLEENDFMTFKYNGDSQFDVLMFDGRSLCEKEASYFVRKCEDKEDDNGCQTKRGTPESSVEVIIASPGDVAGGSQPEKCTDGAIDAIPLGWPIISRVANKKTWREIKSFKPIRTRRRIQNKQIGAKPGGFLHQTKRKTGENCAAVIIVSPGDANEGSKPEKSANGGTDLKPLGQSISLVSNKKTRREIKLIRAISARQSAIKKEPSTCAEEMKLIKAIRTMQSVRGEEPSTCAGEIQAIPDDPDVEHTSLSHKKVYRMHYVSNRRPVTEEEISHALLSAEAAVTHEGFILVMKPTHVYKRFYLSIPTAWMVKHCRSMRNQDVILHFEERMWHTRYYYHKARNSGGLSAGWKKFAVDNNLDEFDVCVFEPGSPTNNSIVLDVNIFRVVQEVNLLSPAPKRYRGLTQEAGKKIIQRHPAWDC